jgi:acyl phosphate:glycerol-3-phosphate acyltransferase
MTQTILLTIIAYLLGSINFSILLFKVLGKSDPRESYSGNPGATNVYRQAGLIWAIVVLLLDLGRSVAIAFAAITLLNLDFVPWIGLALILGNRFPCFHGFKGGKGVANFLGFSAVLSLSSAIFSAIAWLIVNFLTKKPFLASFAMIAVLAGGTIINFQTSAIPASGTIVTALLIFWSHRQNIVEFKQEKQVKNA